MRASSSVSVVNWSTSEVPPGQRYDFYAHALASAMFPMHVGTPTREPFEVNMVAACLGGVTVIRQVGTPHLCYADKANIACRPQRTFHLLVNAKSAWTMDHMGRHRLAPGEILLSDSSIPFELNIGADFDFVNVSLSEAWLRQWLPAPAVLVGRKFECHTGWAYALSAFLQGLAPARFVNYPLPMSFVSDQIGALLTLIAQDYSSPPAKSLKDDDALFRRLRDCMYHESNRPQLSASEVAAELGVSLRSLHRCFARFNTTFGETLMRMRCIHAMRMLESPIFQRLTIAEIGRRAGFTDASHFARTLHARVGRTPSQIRRERDKTYTSIEPS
ncbi:helix-turn-helix domain-containing protein [Paraburkholderia sp. ZP32-5]|uniref:helix-turn-helix domain-containing protein n=1 Tax=Paraburkholderia sp. ZP32-5 TaxID=2883245 RepID=UPI001F21C9D3|nr:helix-turn-helix domain-containing protein [Paraburkholderia sp. ZP32-5]